MADFARRFDLDVVRGSSSRGGVEALRELARAIRAGEDVAVVPDGPRGPARRLQAGIVALAATTGAPIVPVGVAARPARRLHSWDRFMVPVPFARCAVVFGGALEVKRHDEREDARARVEQYGAGRIRPHERTHPGPKEDRLRLTRATKTNLSPIFALFSDPSGAFSDPSGAAWQALAPAIDLHYSPVEILQHLFESLPSADVRITTYNQSARQISVDGEANTAALAYEFIDKIKKNPDLRTFQFDMAAPRILPNNHAQFRLEGKPK